MKTSLNSKAIAAEDLLFNKLEVFDSTYQVYRPAVLKHLRWNHKSIQSSPASVVVNGTKVQRVLLEDIILTVAADVEENRIRDERESACFSLSATQNHELTPGEEREAGIRWSKETVSKLKPAAVPLDLIESEQCLSEQPGRDSSASRSRTLNLTSYESIVEGQHVDVLMSNNAIIGPHRSEDVVETDGEMLKLRGDASESLGWRECLVVSVVGNKVTVKSKDFPKHFAVSLNENKIRLAHPAVATFKQLYQEEASALHFAKVTLPSLEHIDRFFSHTETNAESSVVNILNNLWIEHGFLHAEVVVDNSEDGQHETLGIRVFGSLNSIRELLAQLASISAKAEPVLPANSLERRCRRLKLLEVGGETDKSEFFVHESLVGLVIGKQGENIIRVARAYKVEVRVFPDECGVRRLRLYGSDHVRVAMARNELEYQYFEVPFPTEVTAGISRWLMEERGLIQNLCHHTNVHSVWWNSQKSTLIVCGLRLNIRHFLFGLGRVHREARLSIADGKESAKLSAADSPPTDVPSSIQESPFAFGSPPPGASARKPTPPSTGEHSVPKSANSRKPSQRSALPPAFQLFPKKGTSSGSHQRGSRSSQTPPQENAWARAPDLGKASPPPSWAKNKVTDGEVCGPFYVAQELPYDAQFDPRGSRGGMVNFSDNFEPRFVDQRHLDQRPLSHRPPYGKLDFPNYVSAPPGSPQIPVVGPPSYHGEQWRDGSGHYRPGGGQCWGPPVPQGMVPAFRLDEYGLGWGPWIAENSGPWIADNSGYPPHLRCHPPADRAEFEAACYSGPYW